VKAQHSAAAEPSTEQDEEQPNRSADREFVEGGENRELWGILLVLFAFVVGIAAGICFVIVYWTGGSNRLLGGMLALSLAGFGFALVLWSHWLMLHKEATEPREPLPSPAVEREEAREDFCAGIRDVRRRRVLQWMSAAGLGVFGAMFVSVLRSFGSNPGMSLFNTVWKRGQRLVTVDGRPISVNSLQPGMFVTVFPEDSIGSEKAQTVLIRVNENLLQLPKDRANWAPSGYVGYSRVCTHAGCSVGMFEPKANLLLCPCHQSTFDVLRGATPTGGPAARPLPQLPLYADKDGTLRAGGGFTEPPGPGFWGMP
jgi:ubiquinol-cytochrome c reductase iron-sulfur subunit